MRKLLMLVLLITAVLAIAFFAAEPHKEVMEKKTLVTQKNFRPVPVSAVQVSAREPLVKRPSRVKKVTARKVVQPVSKQYQYDENGVVWSTGATAFRLVFQKVSAASDKPYLRQAARGLKLKGFLKHLRGKAEKHLLSVYQDRYNLDCTNSINSIKCTKEGKLIVDARKAYRLRISVVAPKGKQCYYQLGGKKVLTPNAKIWLAELKRGLAMTHNSTLRKFKGSVLDYECHTNDGWPKKLHGDGFHISVSFAGFLNSPRGHAYSPKRLPPMRRRVN